MEITEAKIKKILLAGALLAFLGVTLFFQIYGPGKKKQKPSPRRPSSKGIPKSKGDFFLAIGGEELGYLEPCGCSEGLLGGLLRRDSLLQYFKNKKIFPLAMGDSPGKPGRLSQMKLETLKKALKIMKYRAYSLGEKELAILPFFRPLFRPLSRSMPVICANLFRKSKRIFPPTTTISVEIKGQKFNIAIISVISQNEGAGLARIHGLELKKPQEVLPNLLQNLSANLRLLLFHGSKTEARNLLRKFPLLDVIVYAHRVAKPHFERVGNQLLIANSQKAKHLILLGWKAGKKPVLVSQRSMVLDDFVPDSPRMTRLYNRYIQRVRQSGISLDFASLYPISGGTFVGNQRCFRCHKYATSIWKKSAHSQGFSTLKKKGQHKNPECLSCHTVGYGFISGFVSQNLTPALKAIGCESCHGPGSNHINKPERGYGLGGKKNCLKCHTKENSPKFDFRKYYPKIKHIQDRK